MNIFFGIFLLLHGLVHMWYVTLSQGWVAFQADMGWTGQSWMLSGLFSESVTKWLATLLFVLAAIVFATSGVGKLLNQDWARAWIAPAAIISALTILIFWDGRFQYIVQKGLIGLMIDISLVVWFLWFV